MKEIYFIRHAKGKKEGASDMARALNLKGEEAAKMMANRLKKGGILPNAIFCSVAARALNTAKIFADEMKFSGEFEVFDTLYEANLGDMFNFIRSIDDKFSRVFIIGHNPAIAEISEFLSDSIIEKFPTCAVFGIKFDVENFRDIVGHSGEVIIFDYPKKIH